MNIGVQNNPEGKEYYCANIAFQFLVAPSDAVTWILQDALTTLAPTVFSDVWLRLAKNCHET